MWSCFLLSSSSCAQLWPVTSQNHWLHNCHHATVNSAAVRITRFQVRYPLPSRGASESDGGSQHMWTVMKRSGRTSTTSCRDFHHKCVSAVWAHKAHFLRDQKNLQPEQTPEEEPEPLPGKTPRSSVSSSLQNHNHPGNLGSFNHPWCTATRTGPLTTLKIL